MKRLLPYVRRHWLGYSLGIFCTLATATLQMIEPLLIRDAINAVERGHLDRLWSFVELLAAIAILGAVMQFFSRFVVFNTGRSIEYELRNNLFGHLTRLGPEFYQRLRTGDLMSRLINDLTAVRMMLGMGVLAFTSTPFLYVYALAFMTAMNARLTLASVIPYLVLFVGIRRLSRSLMERNLKVQQGLGTIAAKVQESLAGIHVVKAYTLEEHEAARFHELNDDYNQQGLAVARLRGAMFPMIRSAVATSTMIVLIYGGSLVLLKRISIGDLVGFMAYLGRLAWPTTSLGWMISIYQRGKASMKRLGEIFDAVPVPTVEGAEERLKVAGALEWDHVSFSYFARDGSDGKGAAPCALRDISVKVPPGGKLAIVGRTGSGKSTMAKLLVRLIQPSQGRVLLDGRDICELPLKALRRTIGLVPQEPTLFSDTLARNIAFAQPDTPLSEIAAAAAIAGLEGDIAILPHGLETIVGERGMSLSGGQKQRVTIARLLTSNPAVVVLDDALSSVDTETERAVLESLEQSVRDRTTIVVAHRASTVRDADQIIVLEDGAIAERGTHQELMARRGIYAELFRRQLLEEELARY